MSSGRGQIGNVDIKIFRRGWISPLSQAIPQDEELVRWAERKANFRSRKFCGLLGKNSECHPFAF